MAYEPLSRYGWVKQPTPLKERPEENGFRECKDCGNTYPLTSEFFYKKSIGRFRNRCKKCHNLRRASHHIAPVGEHGIMMRKLYKRRVRKQQYIAEGRTLAPRYYWTLQRAAAELEITMHFAYKMVHSGELPAIKHLDLWWRVNPADVQKMKARRNVA